MSGEAVEQAAQVLAAHTRLTALDVPFTCSCDPHTRDGTQSYSAHLLDVLIQANLLATTQGAGEATRRAVEAWLEDGSAEGWQVEVSDMDDGSFRIPDFVRKSLRAALVTTQGAGDETWDEYGARDADQRIVPVPDRVAANQSKVYVRRVGPWEPVDQQAAPE